MSPVKGTLTGFGPLWRWGFERRPGVALACSSSSYFRHFSHFQVTVVLAVAIDEFRIAVFAAIGGSDSYRLIKAR